jgi:hypothetical protein
MNKKEENTMNLNDMKEDPAQETSIMISTQISNHLTFSKNSLAREILFSTMMKMIYLVLITCLDNSKVSAILAKTPSKISIKWEEVQISPLVLQVLPLEVLEVAEE